jgi:hypothetical protein
LLALLINEAPYYFSELLFKKYCSIVFLRARFGITFVVDSINPVMGDKLDLENQF